MADSPILSPEELRQRLSYDPGTGQIRRKVWLSEHCCDGAHGGARATAKNLNTRYAGAVVGTRNNGGYLSFRISGHTYKSHRVAWALHYGDWPNGEIDHIDGDRTNNRISNLRDVPRIQNMRNKARYSSNQSGCTGVYWHRQSEKWRATIKVNGKDVYLGGFVFLDDAIAARKSAEIANGYHANHGRAA